MKFELSNNFKARLKVEIENQNVKFIKSAFHEVSHVDVAELLYEFNSLESKYVLDNIERLVLKPVNESGGYGILIGPTASKKELNEYKLKIINNPRNFVAQPLIRLSTSPTIIKSSIQPRHIDLRPFILSSKKTFITNGGLTRVALKKGSTIVNSSQGGGSKDTWVVN